MPPSLIASSSINAAPSDSGPPALADTVTLAPIKAALGLFTSKVTAFSTVTVAPADLMDGVSPPLILMVMVPLAIFIYMASLPVDPSLDAYPVKLFSVKVKFAAVPEISMACPDPVDVNELFDISAAFAGELEIIFVFENVQLSKEAPLWVNVGQFINVVPDKLEVDCSVTVAFTIDVPLKFIVEFAE